VCLGCGRTFDEIARWTAYTDVDRSRIMAELPRRLEAKRRRNANAAAF
jgi:predicted Fe-S protein YdhL (DUF1289 family)